MIIFIVLSLPLSAVLLPLTHKIFAATQQLGYKSRKLLIKSDIFFRRLFLLALLSLLSFFILSTALIFVQRHISAYGGFLAVFGVYIFFIYLDGKEKLKLPLKNTRRMIRLKTTFCLLSFLVCLGLFLSIDLIYRSAQNKYFYSLRFAPFSLLCLLSPLFVALSLNINKIFENRINNYYINKAYKKIKNSNVKVIGITGSYAKTSVKNILTTILSKHFRVLSAKGSHNTLLGVAQTINLANLENLDYIILEMGAKHKGDIAKICKIAPPDMAIITGICPQHLQTFLTVENIESTKYEIIENLKDGGCAIFGYSAKKLYDKFNGRKLLVGDDLKIDNLKLSKDGLEFNLIFGKSQYQIKSVLLGAHNAENILIAAALAKLIGISFEDIALSIKDVKFEKHRLQLIAAQNGFNILDDSFNANVKGAEAALDVLKLFENKKAVITPGIVELGSLEKLENFKLGQILADAADFVILVGKSYTDIITDGLISKGFSNDNLFSVQTLDGAVELLNILLTSGDTVLFLNDLPDFYI